MGQIIRKEPCPKCRENGNDRSGDNLKIYEDGVHCFACGYSDKVTKMSDQSINQDSDYDSKFLEVEYVDLIERGISKKTCEFWSYGVGEYKGEVVHISQVKDLSGKLIAQQTRNKDKKFLYLGQGTNLPLVGMWLWRPDKNKSIIITEGQIDALTITEVIGYNQPVVSLPNGADAAKKVILRCLEWLLGFKEVKFCFDMDEPGRKAVEECIKEFAPGTASIINLPAKDANQMLQDGQIAELINAITSSCKYVPEGIVKGEVFTPDRLLSPIPRGYSISYVQADDMIRGLSKGRLYVIMAVSGAGKTTIVKEITYQLLTKHKLKLGGIFLEEQEDEPARSLVAIDNNVPYVQLRENPKLLSKDKYQAFYDKYYRVNSIIFSGNFSLSNVDDVLAKLEYLAISEEVDFIIYDNLTYSLSCASSYSEGERRYIDQIMARLRSLANRVNVGVIVLVQPTKSERTKDSGGDTKEWEDLTMYDAKGAGSIYEFCDVFLALERNLKQKNKRRIVVLKNRCGGKVGMADELVYNDKSGRLEVQI